MNTLLITATDTHAGKTVLTSALAAYFQKYCANHSLGILKPIQSGVGDCERYSQLFALAPEQVTPLRFEAPLAPPIAADREGRRVDLEKIWQAFEALRSTRDFVLVEGLGGLGSPITDETTVADLAWDWQMPAVLVVPVQLGAIGQAVANVALARSHRVYIKGIVLNCVVPRSEQDIADWTPPRLIQSLTQVPVLGILPHLKDLTDLDKLAKVASGLDLERLLPL
ncbi:MAG: dethiobiotin synthase [Scytolyngbya sp. HA4215-MV1]|nr:dethiobiotin synthase [Scytolyngbya sp. HA4215-MV1]